MYFGEKREVIQDKSYKLCKTRSNCLHQSFISALSWWELCNIHLREMKVRQTCLKCRYNFGVCYWILKSGGNWCVPFRRWECLLEHFIVYCTEEVDWGKTLLKGRGWWLFPSVQQWWSHTWSAGLLSTWETGIYWRECSEESHKGCGYWSIPPMRKS